MAQRQKIQQFCKNHQAEIGTFFLADQPWIKFCSECALNMALCGKKIDKDLTSEEFEVKTQVLCIRERMRNILTRIEPGRRTVEEITTKIESANRSEVSKWIKEFDEYVRHLCEIRDGLVCYFEQGFSQTLQVYLEKQTKMLLCEIQLKENLEYIEANYRRIIENKEEFSMEHKFDEWSNLIAQLEGALPTSTQIDDVEEAIMDRTTLLYKKLLEIEPFKLGWELDQKTTKYTEPESIVLSQCKQNSRKTQLRLRSHSKRSEKKGEKEYFKLRKPMKDVSNFQMLQLFHP